MGVEFSQVLRVLVHEIRGPLGILQGYLRLLRDGRLDADATERTVRAMLEATGRLSTLTREASELVPWYETGHARDTRPLPLRVLIDQTLAAVGDTREISLVALDDVTEWRIHTGAGHALSSALAAIVDWASRQGPGPVPFIVSVDPVKSTATITIGPPGAHHAGPGASEHPTSAVALPFAAGGHGLALVLAGVVLESHGADVRANDRQLVVRFPSTRGSE